MHNLITNLIRSFSVAGSVTEVEDFVIGHLLGESDRFALLPVGLAVELVRPEETGPLHFRRSKQDDVGRNALTLLDEDEVANLNNKLEVLRPTLSSVRES